MNTPRYVVERALSLGMEMIGYQKLDHGDGAISEHFSFDGSDGSSISFQSIVRPGDSAPRISLGGIITKAPCGTKKVIRPYRAVTKAGFPDKDYVRTEIYKGVKNITGSIGKVKVKK